MRTRTTITAAALLAALAGLAGCGSDGKADAKPAASPTPAATLTADPEPLFLSSVHAAGFESWKTKGPTDEELVAYPPQWCAELRAGHSVDYILSMQGANLYPIGMGWGTAKPEAQELVVFAVDAYCPTFREQVTKDLRDSGGY